MVGKRTITRFWMNGCKHLQILEHKIDQHMFLQIDHLSVRMFSFNKAYNTET